MSKIWKKIKGVGKDIKGGLKKGVKSAGRRMKVAARKIANFALGIFIRKIDYGRFGCFDNINCTDKRISEENFPPGENEQGIKDIPFKFFDSCKSLEEVIKKMKKKKCRPATIREFLNVVEYPSKIPWRYRRYRKRSIVALGSVYRDLFDNKYVTVLTVTSHSREISLIPLDSECPLHFSFLAVYKGDEAQNPNP